jgi:hypothetical protein
LLGLVFQLKRWAESSETLIIQPTKGENVTGINSVSSVFLSGMTDEQISEAVKAITPELLAKVFPGTVISSENSGSVAGALAEAGADFLVRKDPMRIAHPVTAQEPDGEVSDVRKFVATVRTDTLEQLGVVGDSFGLLQTADALEALDILAREGAGKIVNVEVIDGGARVRVAMLLAVSQFDSIGGEPNTLGHFALFEIAHNGDASNSVVLFTLRCECLNGMTSKAVISKHTLSHRSQIGSRLEAWTRGVLVKLLGEVKAETAIFASLAGKALNVSEFEAVAHEFLGGALNEEDGKRKKMRRDREVAELLGYFEGGNQGAGDTLWGGYCSFTRFAEAKRERLDDHQRMAKRFDSNLQGDGQRMITRGLKLLQR